MSFTSIPILDLALARDPKTKPKFLEDLRHALLEVGFLYLKNVGISDEFFNKVIAEGKGFFEIPQEEKLKIEMKNAKSFLGYSQLSAEITAGAIDHREQIDLSTEHPVPGPLDPLYYNLHAPNQWPSPSVLPNFRQTFTDYMDRMGAISVTFTSLIAEAIQLPADAFNKYFDAHQQHKLKVVKYPDLQELGLGDAQGQGGGPHKDSMLTSYLLQASAHRGLQVQNVRGEWIDCPPIDGTLVVAIGQGLEALTQGVCVSTTHRVLSPEAGQGARFSIPFFQGVRGDAEFEDLETVGVGRVPDEVRRQRQLVIERNGGERLDDVEFTFRRGGVSKTLGEATLRNRVKSHPDVGERWYPDILAHIREQEAQLKKAEKGLSVTLPAAGAPPVTAH
ncbi:Putative inactive serine/threonine-protein kinase slob1 [Verticillium dahliae VDG1]|nr:Putative inactive serine/threonine-protein kinase slob1 [Verticillium dahliae VDG1]